MKTPQDYEDGVYGLINDKEGWSDPYEDVLPLAQRKTTDIKLKAGEGDGDAAMALKYGYSAPLTQVSRSVQTLYGYMRDANIRDRLEQSAVKNAHALHELIFDAPCVNREGRYAYEEQRAKEWMNLIEPESSTENDDDKSDPIPDLNELLHNWSEADAFMLRARIVEEQRGIEAAEPMYEEYHRMAKQRDDAELAVAKLEPAVGMLFLCRKRQYEIMRERGYDLAMGYPTHDFTEVKSSLNETDINKLVHKMDWAFREAYQLVMGSMLDGEAFRTTLMSLSAGQLPPQPAPWPGYYPGMVPPNGHDPQEDSEDEEKPDKHRAVFSLFTKPQKKEKPSLRRRASRRGQK